MSVRLKEIDTERVFLTEPELQMFFKVKIEKYQKTQNAFFFSCCTGLRMSDVLALTFDQIKDGKLTFRQQKTKKVEYFSLSKDALKIFEKQREYNPIAEMCFTRLERQFLIDK
jgi:integrase